MILGDLLAVNYWECPPEKIRRGVFLTPRFAEVVASVGLEVLRTTWHDFDGGGATGFVIVGASHAAYHSYWQQGLVIVQVYSCGPDPTPLVEKLAPVFYSKRHEWQLIRGKPLPPPVAA